MNRRLEIIRCWSGLPRCGVVLALLSFVCTLAAGPVEEAAFVKVLSTSPDGNTDLVTIVPKGSNLEGYEEDAGSRGNGGPEGYVWVLKEVYARDKRSKHDALLILEEGSATRQRASITWAKDSSWFQFLTGDERTWGEYLFVRFHDAKEGVVSYRQPVIPDLKEIVKKNTHENPVIFQECPGGISVRCHEWWQDWPDNVELVKGDALCYRFTAALLTYASNSRVDRSRQQYKVTFETSDWTKFDLKKIVRAGYLVEGSYQYSETDDSPLVLYPQKK